LNRKMIPNENIIMRGKRTMVAFSWPRIGSFRGKKRATPAAEGRSRESLDRRRKREETRPVNTTGRCEANGLAFTIKRGEPAAKPADGSEDRS